MSCVVNKDPVTRDSRTRLRRADGGKPSSAGRSSRNGRVRLIVAAGMLAALAAAATWPWWMPPARHAFLPAAESGEHAESADNHAGHDHGAADDTESLELSPQGRKNIGLELVTVELSDFEQTISVPATLAERPGRSQITVSAPMTGILTRTYPIRGAAVAPGDPLFDLRLTHEDLVTKQAELLRALEELDVVKKEVARLEEVTASGAVAGKRLLEGQYEQRKIEAAIRAERQALLLHGLSEEQVDSIVEDRRLLSSLTIKTPPLLDCVACTDHEEYLQVASLPINPGEQVAAGTQLGTLTDHCELYVEGKAFEHDAEALNRAANDAAPVTAVIDANGSGQREVEGLEILYVESEVERDSRALKFYVALPNELVRNETTADGHRFISWRYRPGQRVELLVPIKRWEEGIVLPVEAVVQEGAEWYVYRKRGDRFERQPVHVEHRDGRHAVIESDGALFPGDQVAGQGAYQIHLALKNKAGGGADAHAGHHH